MLRYKTEHDLDSPFRTIQHRKIILNKTFLKKLYDEWYTVFVKEAGYLPEGKIVELGSGGGYLKDVLTGIITSDILDLPHVDMVFSALSMPFNDIELSGFFMLDTFHHIPDSYAFLKEAERVLKPGGKIIMIEPAATFWGKVVYKNFHHEPFNEKDGWQIPSSGPMSGANGALPWIVFERDRERFTKEFPNLRIEEINYHTPLRYLISGGVSFRSLAPSWSFGFFRGVDRILVTLSKQFSMSVPSFRERYSYSAEALNSLPAAGRFVVH
jgi:SAM-dependent methyltransferase